MLILKILYNDDLIKEFNLTNSITNKLNPQTDYNNFILSTNSINYDDVKLLYNIMCFIKTKQIKNIQLIFISEDSTNNSVELFNLELSNLEYNTSNIIYENKETISLCFQLKEKKETI